MQTFIKRITEVYTDENSSMALKERMSFWIEMVQIINGETKNFPELMDNKDIDEFEMRELFKRAFTYGKTLYHLGYMDATKDSVNLKDNVVPEKKMSTLSLEDLTSLIKIYDTIKSLDAAITLTFGIQREDSSLEGIPKKIIKIICSSICANMADANEFVKEVTCILCGKNSGGAERRAKTLLDLDFNIT